MTKKRTIDQARAEQVRDLPTPEVDKVVTVPLNLYPAYLALHGLEEMRYVSDKMECKKLCPEGVE